MNIIILAAGLGKRLEELTKLVPKCLAKVNGIPILEQTLNNFQGLPVDNLVFVTGHLSNEIKNYFNSNWSNKFTATFIHNPVYDKTNNIYSLWLARDYMSSGAMIVESDVFFQKEFFNNFSICEKNYWFGDYFTSENDGCRLTTDKSGKITKIEIIREKVDDLSRNHFKSVGILYLCKENKKILDLLDYEIKQNNTQIYFDLFFAKYINEINIYIKNISPSKWFEIDDKEDLAKARVLFA